MVNTILTYCGGVFLLIYGGFSLKAGIKRENRAYVSSIGWDDTKKWLKDKYIPTWNILLGLIALIFGLLILILYRPSI